MMGKRLFLFVLFNIIGVIASSANLTADNYTLTTTPDFDAVETVEVVETVEATPVTKATVVAAKPRSTSVKAATPAAPANNISVAGRTINIVQVASTATDSGNHVNRYGDKFLYGHNSGAVFGNLVNLGRGSVFSVTLDGNTVNYRVQDIVIYEKNVDTGRLELNGQGNYMAAVAGAYNRATGTQYGLSLMTCYGTSYGNGDASHRLVIFANAI